MNILDASPNIEIPDREVTLLPGSHSRRRGMLKVFPIEIYEDGLMAVRYCGDEGSFLIEVTVDESIEYFRYVAIEEESQWWWGEMDAADLPDCYKEDLQYCIRETRGEAHAARF